MAFSGAHETRFWYPPRLPPSARISDAAASREPGFVPPPTRSGRERSGAKGMTTHGVYAENATVSWHPMVAAASSTRRLPLS